MGPKFVRVIFDEDLFLLPNLLYDGSYIITRKLFSAFQHIEDFISPHALIDAAILIRSFDVNSLLIPSSRPLPSTITKSMSTLLV